MTELERLIQQRAEITRKIQELRGTDVRTENARFMHDNRRWVVSLRVPRLYNNKPRWAHIVETTDKDEAINRIDTVIASLNELKEKIKEEMQNVQDP